MFREVSIAQVIAFINHVYGKDNTKMMWLYVYAHRYWPGGQGVKVATVVYIKLCEKCVFIQKVELECETDRVHFVVTIVSCVKP